MRKGFLLNLRQMKAQNSLLGSGHCALYSTSESAFVIAQNAKQRHVDNEASGQTARKRSLVWVHYENMPI